ncbi:MAG TPA: OmpA family protein [Polyangiaceae bacterium]|nr:OmpA family protein [Polyangiaceae bacterium]
MLKKTMRIGGALVLATGTLSAQTEPATDAASEPASTEDASASGAVSLSTEGSSADVAASTSGDVGSDVPYMKRHAPTDGRFEFGFFTGYFFPSPGHDLFSSGTHEPYEWPSRYMLGGRMGWYPSKFLGLELEYMHARSAVTNPVTDTDTRADFNAYRAQLVGQLALWSVVPFVVVGGGALQANGNVLGPDTDSAFHFGAGFKVALSDPVALRLQFNETLTNRVNDEYAGMAWHDEIQVGLAFNLDRPAPAVAAEPAAAPDADGDTVPDMKDECADVPALTPNGCPPDGDGDGVVDPQDHCPFEKGVAPNGCPELDSDKDGVPLPCDICPEEKGVQPDGCPVRDTDGDGILDDKDKCVKEPETKNGFDDTDGCPDEIPKEVKAFTGVIQGIEFDRGKATIRKTSVRTLSKAVEVLKKFPTVRVEISGHTSSEGNEEFNQKLSEDRAASVKAWIVDHGVEQDRIQTRGAGSSEPLADNKTAAGKAKNRRIEFKLLQ